MPDQVVDGASPEMTAALARCFRASSCSVDDLHGLALNHVHRQGV